MADCPDGRMDRDKMKQMFAAIMPEVRVGLTKGVFPHFIGVFTLLT